MADVEGGDVSIDLKAFIDLVAKDVKHCALTPVGVEYSGPKMLISAVAHLLGCNSVGWPTVFEMEEYSDSVVTFIENAAGEDILDCKIPPGDGGSWQRVYHLFCIRYLLDTYMKTSGLEYSFSEVVNAYLAAHTSQEETVGN